MLRQDFRARLPPVSTGANSRRHFGNRHHGRPSIFTARAATISRLWAEAPQSGQHGKSRREKSSDPWRGVCHHPQEQSDLIAYLFLPDMFRQQPRG